MSKKISITLNQSTDTLKYINGIGNSKELNKFVNDSIRFYYNYLFAKKNFITSLIIKYYSLCRHLLRRIGSFKKQNETNKIPNK